MTALDPRSKFLILAAANLLLFLHAPVLAMNLFMGLVFLLFLCSKHKKTGLRFFAVYIILRLIPLPGEENTLLYYLSFLGSSLCMMMPCLFSGMYLCMTTKPSEMVAALRKCKIPETVIIPVCVVIRFFPAIHQEMRHIRDAMLLREIGGRSFFLLHPAQTLEHYLIPLLMSASVTAQDLSAAAICRGIENKGKHTSLIQPHFTWKDGAAVLCSFAVLLV